MADRYVVCNARSTSCEGTSLDCHPQVDYVLMEVKLSCGTAGNDRKDRPLLFRMRKGRAPLRRF